MGFVDGLRTIVVAADLDRSSHAALEYARKLANAYGARIVLAHGIDPVEYAAVGAIPSKLREGVSEKALEALQTLSAELSQEGIHNHTEVRQGAVAQMLVDIAEQYEAGLIVIGTGGLDGAGALVVGSVAEQVVRLAPCPVLAVAADWNAGPFRPTPGGPVLLAVEKNAATTAAVETAVSLAKTFKRPLYLVHARSAAESIAFLNPSATTPEEFGIKPSSNLTVNCIVRDGAAEDVIGEAIAEFRPCILVIGVKRVSETPGPHGTAFSLLARSRVPVLCVPPAEKPVAAF